MLRRNICADCARMHKGIYLATPAMYSNRVVYIYVYTRSLLDRSHDVIELSLLPGRNYMRASFINNGKIHKLTRYRPSECE